MHTAFYVRPGRSLRKAHLWLSLGFHASFSQAFFHLGVNEKLGLSGRPNRPIGCLGTSKVVARNFYIFVTNVYFR